MKENNWNLTFPESFSRTMEELNKVQLSASALAMSQAWKAAVPDYKLNGVYAALNEIVASHREWSKSVLPTNSFVETMKAVYPTLKIDLPNVTQSILSQIDTSTIAALRESASMAALAKADWSWLSEVHTEEEEYEDESVLDSVTESSITPEIRAEIAADITQVLSNPETMHIDSQSKYLQWKERNPGFAAFFIEILLPILLLIADWGFSSWQARTVKDSHIYEEPTSASSIVYNVTVENNVTVVGDVPYYYEVEFVNQETGELVTGYIYKGNIEAEEPDETEVHVEATEATEESEPTSDTTESQTEPLE